jgi:tetratricopeptide (TPR) repeat protein
LEYNRDIPADELEQIERYVQDEMGEDEALAFARRIQTDERLKRRVHEVRLTLLGIEEALLPERLDSFHNDIKSTSGVRKRLNSYSLKWAVAASLLFIVALSVMWFTSSKNQNERIYSRYYIPDPGLMTLMSTSPSNYTFEKAMVEYKSGEYNKALKAWAAMLKTNPRNDTLMYFSGAASQAMGNYEAAISYLEPVANNNTSLFRSEACWYVGLSYVKKGDNVKAMDYLKRSERNERKEIVSDLNKQ